MVSRGLGREFREELEQHAADGQDAIVDFEGVMMAAPSFADEVFGKLSRDLTDHGAISFINVPDSLAPLVRFVRSSRAAA